jgi:hypothetical protein
VTVVVNTVPTSDNPDWQVTAVGPGGSAVVGPNPATSVTGPDSYSSPAMVGTSLAYARQDHDHGLPAAGGGSGGGDLLGLSYIVIKGGSTPHRIAFAAGVWSRGT